MINKFIWGALSLVVLINGAFIAGMYFGSNAHVSMGLAVFSSIMAITGLLSLIAVGALSLMAGEEALEKIHKLDVELKSLRREQQDSQANTLKERVKSERSSKDLSRKPTSPVRPNRPSQASRRFDADLQITSA